MDVHWNEVCDTCSSIAPRSEDPGFVADGYSVISGRVTLPGKKNGGRLLSAAGRGDRSAASGVVFRSLRFSYAVSFRFSG